MGIVDTAEDTRPSRIFAFKFVPEDVNGGLHPRSPSPGRTDRIEPLIHGGRPDYLFALLRTFTWCVVMDHPYV